MLKLFDTNDPFFRPLWLRVAIVALTTGWAAVEFATGSPSWGVLFAAIAAYCVWGFFIRFRPNPPAQEKDRADR